MCVQVNTCAICRCFFYKSTRQSQRNLPSPDGVYALDCCLDSRTETGIGASIAIAAILPVRACRSRGDVADDKFRSHARWALVPRAPVDDSTLPQGSTRDAEHPDTFVLRVGVGEGKSEWRRRSGLGIGPCAADGVATLVMMPTHRRKMVRRRLCASGSVGADSKCATAVRPLAPLNFRLPRRRCLVGRETTISYSTIVVVSCSSDTSLVGVSLPTRTCRSRGDVADDKFRSTTPSLFCSMAMTLLTTRQPTYCRTMAPWIRQIPVTSL
jgi:hypothetical protein